MTWERKVSSSTWTWRSRRTVSLRWTWLTCKIIPRSWDTLIVKSTHRCCSVCAVQSFLSLTTTKPPRTHFKVPCPSSPWVWTVLTTKSECRPWSTWCTTLKGLWSSPNPPSIFQSSRCQSAAIQSWQWPASPGTTKKIVSSLTRALSKGECLEVCSTEHTRVRKISLRPTPPWLKYASPTRKSAKSTMRQSWNSTLMELFHPARPSRTKKYWLEKSFYPQTPTEAPFRPEESIKTPHWDQEEPKRVLSTWSLCLKMLNATSSQRLESDQSEFPKLEISSPRDMVKRVHAVWPSGKRICLSQWMVSSLTWSSIPIVSLQEWPLDTSSRPY